MTIQDKVIKCIKNIGSYEIHLSTIEVCLREAGENVDTYDVEKLIIEMIMDGKIEGVLGSNMMLKLKE